LQNVFHNTRRLICSLLQDTRGAMAIETAVVAPLLVLMAIGSFQVSSMVARQSELQNAAAEAAAIALASPPTTETQLDTVKDVMLASTGIGEDAAQVSFAYRCGSATSLVTSKENCGEDETVWTFMRVQLQATYKPVWTKLGVGSDVNMVVDRYVQIS